MHWPWIILQTMMKWRNRKNNSCHVPELFVSTFFWTILNSPSNVGICQLQWWEPEQAYTVEFLRGTCLPVPAVSNVEHFWFKKKNVGEYKFHCCVLSFLHELGDNRREGQRWNNCVNVKGQTQPDRNDTRLLGDIQLLKSAVDTLCTVEVADEGQCLVAHSWSLSRLVVLSSR